jgi:hypothetical protein
VGRYTVSTDIVFDNVAKVTWQRSAAPSTYSWSAATSYCQTLSLGGFSAGWRLPTVKELLFLVDESVSNPSIDGVAFPNTTPNFFWSSSLNSNTSGTVWAVYFYSGVTSESAASVSYSVRCVR